MTTIRADAFKLGDKFATLLGDEVKVGDWYEVGCAHQRTAYLRHSVFVAGRDGRLA